MKLKIWKWYHNWGDDSSTALYPTEAAASEAIYNYVRDNWNEGVMDDEELSGEAGPDIEKYFEWHDEEWYSLEAQDVEFNNLPAIQDEDVILTSDECAVVVAALDAVDFEEIAEDMNIPPQLAADLITSAYNKIKD
jgi:hypothetical protein